MPLQITNIQGSYSPSGEWISKEEATGLLSAGGASSPQQSFSAQFADPGQEFYRRTQSAGTPTHPDYGFGAGPDQPLSPTQFPQTKQRQISPARSTAVSTTTIPRGPAPIYEAGEFEAPEYDEGAYKAGQQKLAAPGLRRLRDQISRVQSRTYQNPNVKAMTLREALQGYGSGVESVLAGAYSRATAEYEKKYRRDYETQLRNFQAQESAKQTNFRTALASWSKGIDPTTTDKQPTTSPYTTTRAPGVTSRGY